MAREARIDIIRGMAMITIAINHLGVLLVDLGYRGSRIPTLTLYGFSTAAEIFYLVSGYMVGFVYMKANQMSSTQLSQKMWARAAKIYCYNAAVFALLLLLSPLIPEQVEDATKLDYTLESIAARAVLFLTFLQHPSLLGVLQLYVLLMLVTPLAAMLVQRSWLVLFLVSAALYICVRVFPTFNLPGGAPETDGLWEFNPFAWQFLFFAGVLLGRVSAHRRLFSWIDQVWTRPIYLLALFTAAAVVYKLHRMGVIYVPSVSKNNVGLANLLHTFVAVAAMAALATLVARYSSTLASLLSVVGKHTLECYAVSIPLTYIAASFWTHEPGKFPSYLLAAGFVVTGVCFVAFVMEQRKNASIPATAPRI